jgi:OmpA-OmpF porin, OOP family
MKYFIFLLTMLSTTVMASDNWESGFGVPWKNSSGECWRNANWTPATASKGCDGALTERKPSVPAPAPAVVKSAATESKPATLAVATKFTLRADALFDFDKAIIKPEGQTALNKLAADLKGTNLEVVIVVGHTDNVGTDAYNLALGHRRATVVKAYLSGQGIPSVKIYTDSKGEANPIASNKTAEGRAKNRRVDIEVIGTK